MVHNPFRRRKRCKRGLRSPAGGGYSRRALTRSALPATCCVLGSLSTPRARLNGMIKETLQAAADAWGMTVKRYEITEITPDKQISEAMDKQAAAERVRR